MDTEVLVVGAGPTGLVLALWLARLGIQVRIIDKTAGPGSTSRALAVQARTLEFYRQLGFADELVEAGLVFSAANLWARGRSEEHTSELQSLAYLVCRLLLEKKKNNIPHHVYFNTRNTPTDKS